MDKILLDALASSGIVFNSESEANAAGFFEYTADHATQYGFRTFGHGLLIKYPSFTGKINGAFCRVRFTTPLQSFKSKRPIRYLQPPESLPQLYLPNCGLISWIDAAANTELPIIITEGEKKAYASQLLLGIHTIGLGGVSSFSQRKLDSQPLLTEFEHINFKRRKVYIAYDSDIATNMNVARSELVLAEALANVGADVYFMRLPNLDNKKLGLDDAIVELGAGAVLEYVEEAEPFVNARALATFGRNCWYVRKQQSYIELSTGNMLDPRKAANSYYASAKYLRKDLNSKGEVKMTKANLFKDYNEWPARNEFEAVVNAPGKPIITEDNEYNLWVNTAPPPVEGDVSIYLEFCKYFFSDDPQMEGWWHNWVATLVQQPGVKLQTAWILYSHQTGTGKSTLARLAGAMVGKSFIEGHAELLTDERNDWVIGKQLALIDDLNDYVNRSDSAKIRSIITRESVHINPKYMVPYDTSDCTNFIITTNEEVSVAINDTDRRFFIVNSPEVRASDDLYKALHAFVSHQKTKGELLHWYLNYKVTGDFTYATRPPTDTKALLEAKENCAHDTDIFAKRFYGEYSDVPETVTILSSRDIIMLYNKELPMSAHLRHNKRNSITSHLSKVGLQALPYRGGLPIKGINLTAYLVGKDAKSKAKYSSSTGLQVQYNIETEARLRYLGDDNSKF